MSDDRTVRPATRADIPAMTGVLSRAFADGAPFTWIQPDDALRARVLPVTFDAALRAIHPVERGAEVLLDGDTVVGVAAWAPPGKWTPPLLPLLLTIPRMAHALGLRNMGEFGRRGQAVEKAMNAVHPTEPHWYLAILGTDPAAHGRGVGSALLRSGLARCDRDGLPAYLECLESLVPFYGRFGFEVTGKVAMPDGTPDHMTMWRPSSGQSGAATAAVG